MKELISEKIKLWGIVQGVGFRPFVAKLADRMGMKGEVLNIGGLVDIVLTDTAERIESFLEALQKEKPLPAEIVHMKRMRLEFRDFDSFTILDSQDGGDEAAMIPADLSICPDCLAELRDPQNPRYMHPFISCMICGPRYTIMDKIPYDRDTTAMIDWPMCDYCNSQYTDRKNRRYHAQTISCHDCGPVVKSVFYGNTTEKSSELPSAGFLEGLSASADEKGAEFAAETAQALQETRFWAFGGAGDGKFAINDAVSAETMREKIDSQVLVHLAEAKRLLDAGEVIAVKGVGGYNLVCDPTSERAVARLREIKNREQKPFAVMFRDMEQIKEYCYVDEVEEKLLISSAKPILLLEHRPIREIEKIVSKIGKNGSAWEADSQGQGGRAWETDSNAQNCCAGEIDSQGQGGGAWKTEVPHTAAEFEKSRFIGSFLPSMGLQYMLLHLCERPLIVTSANLSDMPIIKDDREMLEFMESQQGLVAAVFYNERDIRLRVDDSVVRVIDGQPQMIRRSKGYAPVPLYIECGQPLMVLATGGQLKNSFALSKNTFSYVSQYFGDLDSEENYRIYGENVERMSKFFKIEPQLVACDMHPLYRTTRFAEEYVKHAAQQGRDVELVKVQHHHAHVASVMAEHHLTEPVIGVSMDGTGYGTDGAIWGGEFLLCEGGEFERMAHLKYVKMLGGDSSMKEAWKSGLCYLYAWEHAYGAETAEAAEKISSSQGFEIAPDLTHIMEYALESGFGGGSKEADMRRTTVNAALDCNINALTSSSMGRLFDAVSALLGIKDYNDYEGQCAIMLEDAAARAQKSPGVCKADDLALEFHMNVADMILKTCLSVREGSMGEKNPGARDGSGRGVTKVALTGGVFQNKILTETTLRLLREAGFEVFYNVSVSPNDGGIALGQNFVAVQKKLARSRGK